MEIIFQQKEVSDSKVNLSYVVLTNSTIRILHRILGDVDLVVKEDDLYIYGA